MTKSTRDGEIEIMAESQGQYGQQETKLSQISYVIGVIAGHCMIGKIRVNWNIRIYDFCRLYGNTIFCALSV